MADGPWYWCLDHEAVEPVDGCPNDRRLGPYETREEAQDAIARARARTEQQDAIDREWSGED
ncbi:SPOR domain-containing protein [Jiangella asiatica]|uniref:SPOR domain-containing protein n=1 Tax=Jiangella asiatica TaxID=2530372 RepID=A0A4R5DR36_9ACTN|nr:SPOR domain-containing protein [Jiangella asiatica]TDE13495.1 SPOR domain-containing protein [Jiangella asiatica]